MNQVVGVNVKDGKGVMCQGKCIGACVPGVRRFSVQAFGVDTDVPTGRVFIDWCWC